MQTVSFDRTQEITITPREAEVLSYILKGYSSPKIAEELNISVGTVKTHLEHLFYKLDVDNRTQLALKASVSHITIEKLARRKAI